MSGKFKFNLYSQKILDYIKLFLVILMTVICIVICAQAFTKVSSANFYATIVCCIVLTVLEAVNAFVIKKFVAKMIFYGLDSALILTICVLTGNSFMSTIYCIVLTQCYVSIEKFKDKTILFGVSCGIFSVSFVIGCVVSNPYTDALEIVTGVLFGLLALVIDYVVTTFLLKFYKTNLELSSALKEADENRARLEEVYEELTNTKVFEERNRIAKDIHDTAGHSMTTVIMQTEVAKLLIDENPEEAKNRIISANIQARNALEQMRESVHLLAGRERKRPLKEEMEEVIAQTIDGTDVKARYDLDFIQPDAETYRFLINSLKELLSNGIRHGKATAFYVELKKQEGGLTMLVSDNGAGVNGKIVEGFGLKGLREKAEKLGGTLSLSSDEGEGFEATITLPVVKEKK
ncbi:MAG: sensor histidine kinase [Clostridia bacterium]|nr:sensor histidine kinase [Clostridia bacterium]